MTTKLRNPFRRELDLNGEKYTLTVSPEGFKLAQKGKRKGIERTWASIVGGDAVIGWKPAHTPTLLGRAHTKH